MPGAKRPYTVKSVLRAAKILQSFVSTSEVVQLRDIAQRSGSNKATAFRILETLAEGGLIERTGKQGYRSRVDTTQTRQFRIGYGAQSNVVPFTATVSDALSAAASAAKVSLLVLNNKFNTRVALTNADRFVAEKVDLVINSQIDWTVAAQIAAKFADAGIPFIAMDIPHPGAFYFGADNYKAGRLAGRYLGSWIQKNWNGEAEEMLFIGVDIAGPTLNTRLTGMQDGILESLPDLRKLPVTHLDTKGQFERTLDLTRKHLRRRKPHRTLVGAVNDTSALAALQAFRDLGIEQMCAIAGQDACLEARMEMRQPSTRLVCSVAYFPETYGTRLVQLALDILNHKPVPPAVFTEHVLVTPGTVNKIYPNDRWMTSVPSELPHQGVPHLTDAITSSS